MRESERGGREREREESVRERRKTMAAHAKIISELP